MVVMSVVHDVTVVMSVSGVAGQVLAGGLLVVGLLALLGVRAPLDRLRSLLSGWELWLAFGVAAASTAGSLFYSEFASFYPGEVAWYERICMYPLSILILLIALGSDRYGVRYVIAFPIVGLSVSGYALLLEDGVVAQSKSCVLSGPGGCVTKWINEFGYVTIPVLSLTSFALILAFLLFAAFSPAGGALDTRARLSHAHATAVAMVIAALAVIAVTVTVIESASPAGSASAAPASPTAVTGVATGNATVGETIFKANSCSVCHTLAAAGAAGTIARPNLGTTKFSYAKIVNTITNGITTKYGAAMAPFKTALSASQIQDIATFIYKTERSHA